MYGVTRIYDTTNLQQVMQQAAKSLDCCYSRHVNSRPCRSEPPYLRGILHAPHAAAVARHTCQWWCDVMHKQKVVCIAFINHLTVLSSAMLVHTISQHACVTIYDLAAVLCHQIQVVRVLTIPGQHTLTPGFSLSDHRPRPVNIMTVHVTWQPGG